MECNITWSGERPRQPRNSAKEKESWRIWNLTKKYFSATVFRGSHFCSKGREYLKQREDFVEAKQSENHKYQFTYLYLYFYINVFICICNFMCPDIKEVGNIWNKEAGAKEGWERAVVN